MALRGGVCDSYAGGVRLGPVSLPGSRRRWASAGNVLLVVVVTALQLVGPRAGSSVRGPVLLPGTVGMAVGVITVASIGIGLAIFFISERGRKERVGGVASPAEGAS